MSSSSDCLSGYMTTCCVTSVGAASSSTPYPDSQASLEAAQVAWRRLQSNNGSIISLLFHDLQNSTLRCVACEHDSSTFETFSALSLPLVVKKEQCSLYHCLKQYALGDTVDDWKCPSCFEINNVHMRVDYWRLPPVIIFHLKRFSSSGVTTQKMDTTLSFPLNDLDLSQLVTGPHSDSRRALYDLYGVVEHHGSQHSGHYTAYYLSQPAGRWCFASDSNVEECTAEKVKDASAFPLSTATFFFTLAGLHLGLIVSVLKKLGT